MGYTSHRELGAASPFLPYGAARHLRLLMVGCNPALATRCLAELESGGFEVVAEQLQPEQEIEDFLSRRSCDLVLAADVLPCIALLGKIPPPIIVISADTTRGRALALRRQGAVDVLSPDEMQRLPLAADLALEIKALRREKAAAEDRYRTLFDRNLAGVYEATPEGSFLDLNETCAHMLACPSREDAKNCTLRGITTSQEEYDRLMQPLRLHGSVSNLELQLRRTNGEPFWALANANMIGTVPGGDRLIEGTLIEITAWKDAQDALRRSENRFRALVENSSDAISLVDATGKVLQSSHAVSPIFGYTLEERLGKNIFELIYPEDLQQTMPLFQKLLSEPSSSVNTVIRYRHKSGKWLWIEALGTNMLGDPSVRAVVINYRDITDRRLLEQQLFQAQKMEAVGRLAGGVAHDFNNLLTAILGYTDMVIERLPRNSLARRYTMEVKRAGERAASLTRQLLAFSRLQVLSPQVVSLNAIIADMSKMLHRLIGEDVTLVTLPDTAMGRIKADPSQIEQVILNLAVNARDAMPQGGELSIRTSDVILDETVTSEGVRIKGGPYVLLEVSDTGSGMNAQTRARIFDPFFTTKEKGKGTGLGLSTVYGIVKQSNGYIWVKSEPGQGSAFQIYLPSVQESLTVSKAQAHSARDRQGSETILVVEDEDAVRTLLGRILRNMGYEALEASRGDEALDLCSGHNKKIHLLLTDVAMPRMNGQELARRVKSLYPQTKVLYMTGYAGNKVGATDVLGEDAEFIQKPFASDALAKKIRQVLGPAGPFPS